MLWALVEEPGAGGMLFDFVSNSLHYLFSAWDLQVFGTFS